MRASLSGLFQPTYPGIRSLVNPLVLFGASDPFAYPSPGTRRSRYEENPISSRFRLLRCFRLSNNCGYLISGPAQNPFEPCAPWIILYTPPGARDQHTAHSCRKPIRPGMRIKIAFAPHPIVQAASGKRFPRCLGNRNRIEVISQKCRKPAPRNNPGRARIKISM
jgi:hypothetical protein